MQKPPANAVGPFDARVRPVRNGVYLRKSPKSSGFVFAHWNGSHFGLYADTPQRAFERRSKRSKADTQWYGLPAAA